MHYYEAFCEFRGELSAQFGWYACEKYTASHTHLASPVVLINNILHRAIFQIVIIYYSRSVQVHGEQQVWAGPGDPHPHR